MRQELRGPPAGGRPVADLLAQQAHAGVHAFPESQGIVVLREFAAVFRLMKMAVNVPGGARLFAAVPAAGTCSTGKRYHARLIRNERYERIPGMAARVRREGG